MKLTFLFIILALVVAAVVYGAGNWQKYGTFWGSKTADVNYETLTSLGNFYDSKNICTKGYIIQESGSIVLKQNLSTDVLNGAVWVNNVSGKSFFVDALGANKAVLAHVCGKFESGRDKDFGQPSVYNMQIDVSNFDLLGDAVQIYP